MPPPLVGIREGVTEHAQRRIQVGHRRRVLHAVLIRPRQNDGDPGEVAGRRRRGNLPFQAAGPPRVAFLPHPGDHGRVDEVGQEDQDRDAEQKGGDRDPVVQRLQAPGVGVDPARLPGHPHREQRQERRVEEDEHRPELDLAQGLVEPDAHDLRQPVVQAAHEREDQAAHDRVVEVRHHEERAVLGGVGGHVGQEHTGDPADQEVEVEPQREQHRHGEPDLRLPEGAQAHQEDEPGRDRDQLRGQHEDRPHVRVDAAVE